MNTPHKYFILLSFCFLITGQIFAHSSIDVDNSNKRLIAPAGADYQWYFKGIRLMNEQGSSIEPKESGIYSVEYLDSDGLKRSVKISIAVTQQGIRKIHIIGDSTVMTYNSSAYPQMGWGQVFQLYFKESDIDVINYAIGGRSSRSFYEEGRWTTVHNALSEGDYVFIQFGHNDRDTNPSRYTNTEDFKDYLRIFVRDTRAKNAIPILISPMILNAWNGANLRNVFTENGNNYRGAMFEVAQDSGVHFVDLNILSYDFVKSVGVEYAANYIFKGFQPGEYPNYPEGSSDGTHFQEMGALKMCNLIIEGLNDLEQDEDITTLVNALTPTYPLNVELKPEQSGIATVSDEYPEGANLTIKTTISAGYTFKRIENGVGETVTTDQKTSVVMGAEPLSYKVIASDCAGIDGGSGYYDICGTCIDENALPCSNSIESERACSNTGTRVTEADINGLETQFILFEAGASDTIHYRLRAPEDGVYEFGIKYGLGSDDQMVDIYVNGIRQINNLALTEVSEGWGITHFSVPLVETNNNISLIFPETLKDIKVDLLTTYNPNVRLGTSCAQTDIIPLSSGIKLSENISVYPNPFRNQIIIQGSKSVYYQIFDLGGQLLDEGPCNQECSIGQSLKSGSYLLRVDSEGSIKSTLIIKQ